MKAKSPAPSRPRRKPVKQQDPLTLELCAALHRQRLRRKMSETALAEKSGVSLSEISELEHGHWSPTVKTLGRLARALGLRGSTLLRRAEDALARRRRR